MRKTEVFGIDIPELGDPSDITVVSDAIHDVENAMGCKIEFMNAVNTPGLISLNSKVRIHPYTNYYDDMVFAFIAPIDIPAGNSIAIKIDDLPQQPFNNEAFNGKGSLVFITYNAKTGFKSYENGSKIINDLTTGGANDALSAEMGKQLQNSKLDKGTVSADYNTAKKIEDRIKEKVSKAGDTMTGALAIKTATWSEIQFNDVNNKRIGTVGTDIAQKKTFLHDYESQSGVDIYIDGRMEIFANNLITPSKEGITAINDIYSILQKNSGLDFDQNLLYLNDSGTKMQGKIYFDRLTQGMFECIQTTTSTVNNTQYFKNISNKENSNRLSNIESIFTLSLIPNQYINVHCPHNGLYILYLWNGIQPYTGIHFISFIGGRTNIINISEYPRVKIIHSTTANNFSIQAGDHHLTCVLYKLENAVPMNNIWTS